MIQLYEVLWQFGYLKWCHSNNRKIQINTQVNWQVYMFYCKRMTLFEISEHGLYSFYLTLLGINITMLSLSCLQL